MNRVYSGFVWFLFRCCLTLYQATFQGKDFWQKELHTVEICLCHLVRKSPSLNNNENEGKEQILYQIYQNDILSRPVCVDEGETAVLFLKEYFTQN